MTITTSDPISALVADDAGIRWNALDPLGTGTVLTYAFSEGDQLSVPWDNSLTNRVDDADAPFDQTRSTPEAQGIDSLGLIRVFRRVRDEGVNLHSLINIRNGYLVLEVYVPP